jgi:hypothetical protein
MGCLHRAHSGSAAIASPFPGLTIPVIILRLRRSVKPPFFGTSLPLAPWRRERGRRDARTTASSLVQVTVLTLTLPETIDVEEFESEIITAVADRLRDDHGYQLVTEPRTADWGTRGEHPLNPTGSIVVDREPGALKIKLKGVRVDAHDLFTGVTSELEQRHEGLRAEIG